MTPLLPAAAIRDAIVAGDLDRAHQLLAEHDEALRAAFDTPGAAQSHRQAWLDLLTAQRELIDELRTARDDAGRALERMGRDRRGMAAYLQAP